MKSTQSSVLVCTCNILIYVVHVVLVRYGGWRSKTSNSIVDTLDCWPYFLWTRLFHIFSLQDQTSVWSRWRKPSPRYWNGASRIFLNSWSIMEELRPWEPRSSSSGNRWLTLTTKSFKNPNEDLGSFKLLRKQGLYYELIRVWYGLSLSTRFARMKPVFLSNVIFFRKLNSKQVFEKKQLYNFLGSGGSRYWLI